MGYVGCRRRILRSLVDLWALRYDFIKSHDTCGLVLDLWARVSAHTVDKPRPWLLFALEGIIYMMGSLSCGFCRFLWAFLRTICVSEGI